MSLIQELLSKKLIISCGTGGVGKTTTSAALALRAALEGKNVALITIDPAKRLATSLGLEKLGSDPVSLNKMIEASLETKMKGSLSALMLDSHNALFRFLKDIGGQEVHDKFAESNLFQVIADNFGGTHEYLAMEKLFELHFSKKYDLIILDTPPARHTLDFLDAPEKISQFFDDRIFSWFITDPLKDTFRERLRAKGTKAALSILEKVTGSGVINDFVTLAPFIYKVKNAFVERQTQIKDLLGSKESGALFISSPTDLSRGESKAFLEDAAEKRITILAFILNRSLKHLAPHANPAELGSAPAEIKKNYQRIRFLVEEEENNLKLLKKLGNYPIKIMPELEKDIHDIPSLRKLAEYF